MPANVIERDNCTVRVVSIYSTAWSYRGSFSEDLSEKLVLGGLKRHYELYQDQLPRLLPFAFDGGPIGAADVELPDTMDDIDVTEVDAMLFALPSNQVVLAITLGIICRPLTSPAAVRPITRLLEQSIEGELRIRGTHLKDFVGRLSADELLTQGLVVEHRPGYGQGEALLAERHQLVFVARRYDNEHVPSPAVVNEIVYRDMPPYREEFSRLKTPEQLNQVRPAQDGSGEGQTWLEAFRSEPPRDENRTTLGVVTPYVSLLYGHQRYVEDSTFLSTVHAVGTASRFRQIWHEAYQQVRRFKEQKQSQAVGQQTRADLEELADNLGNLEFDLTFSVEFPLMRIETFQTALYEAMDLSSQAKALSQMFDQLGGSLRSEITAIDVRERTLVEERRRRDEGRQKWNAVAASIISLIAIPVGFVITFLGINTTEVPTDQKLSMWDPHYAYLYLIAGLLALTPVLLISFPYLRDWVRSRQDRRALGWGTGAVGAGAVLFAMTVVEDRLGPDGAIVVDAFAKAVAIFAVLVGAIIIVLWTAARPPRERP